MLLGYGLRFQVSVFRCQPSRRPEKFTRLWRAASQIEKETLSWLVSYMELTKK
jgi:hypothetical protein